MKEGEILAGVDIPIEFTVTDNDSNPLAISSLFAYHIYVYSIAAGIKTLLLSFKDTPVEVEDLPITIDDDAAGIISIVIPRASTISYGNYTLIAELKLKLTASAEFESSLQVAGDDGFVIGYIKKTASNSIA